jgi:hypothetical protein
MDPLCPYTPDPIEYVGVFPKICANCDGTHARIGDTPEGQCWLNWHRNKYVPAGKRRVWPTAVCSEWNLASCKTYELKAAVGHGRRARDSRLRRAYFQFKLGRAPFCGDCKEYVIANARELVEAPSGYLVWSKGLS